MNQKAVAAHVYFLHIPKVAGTSIKNWLECTGRFRPCPHGLWSALLTEDPVVLRRYDLFHGHFYTMLEQYLGQTLATFTFIRHPFERAFSHFQHVLRDPNHYFHAHVSAHASFLRFMEDPLTRPLASNFQTQALSAEFDPVALWAAPPFPNPHRFWLEEHIETWCGIPADRESLLRAENFLRGCIFVGVTERMQESIRGLADCLGVLHPPPIGHLNSDPIGSFRKFSDSELSVLTNLNQLDLELYDFGMKILDHFGLEQDRAI